MVKRNKRKVTNTENTGSVKSKEEKEEVRGSKRKSRKGDSVSDSDGGIEQPKRKKQKVTEPKHEETVTKKVQKSAKRTNQTSRGRKTSEKPAKKTRNNSQTKSKAKDSIDNVSKLTRTKLEECKEAGEQSSEVKATIKEEYLDAVSAYERQAKVNEDIKYIGAHCCISGGLYKAVLESVDMGGSAFALFLKSQRQWQSKPLDDKDAQKFKDTCKEYDFAPHLIVPHGSYLMNCGSPNEETLQKSRAMLVDELQRCEKLGLTLFNFHPGSTCGEISVEESITRIADSINAAHEQTKYVNTVIENMSCQGHTIGGKFSELRSIIDKVKDKARVGVCLDTCHAFAAGHNIATEEGYEKMMSEFESTIGLKYLKAVHLNDSKEGCGCHKDRHENIGKGKIGIEGFRRLINDPRFSNIPLVLETPEGDYAREIRKLYSLLNK